MSTSLGSMQTGTRLLGSRETLPSQALRPAMRTITRPFCKIKTAKSAASSTSGVEVDRRALLLAGASLLALPLAPVLPVKAGEIKVENLSGFQRADQKSYFQKRVTESLQKVLTADDAQAATLAVINDAGTYDLATRTGGFNGSLRLELDRPENQSLKPFFKKLTQAKEEIDARNERQGFGPISWADLEVMALKVANRAQWLDIKTQRASIASGGSTIAEAFGSDWNVTLGRKDAESPDPEGRVLQSSASAEEVKEWFLKLSEPTSGKPFAPKSVFWDRVSYVLWSSAYGDDNLISDPQYQNWKKKYDRSKGTTTRTEFEVDFAEYSDRLVNLNATKVPDAYLVPIATRDLRL